MIFKDAVPPERKRSSQHNYNLYNLINGFSYMCLGETVIILLAVRIGSPNYVIAALGAMIYIGFLLLPLGKIVTARIGAAQSQATFWVLRNCAALLVAVAAAVSVLGYPRLSTACLLTGAFLFYGFRAAGVVLCQPLIGDLTDDRDRARFIAVSISLFYFSSLAALLVIAGLLKLSQSLLMLSSIVVIGAMFGFTASMFLRKVDETEAIRTSARQPLLPQMRKIFTDVLIRRQLLAGCAVNLAVIMLIPISMLTLKRGYGVSDTEALVFALVQFGACAAMSLLTGKLSEKIGPRKNMLIAYALLLTVALLWLVVPEHLSVFCMAAVFLLCGGCSVTMENSRTHYFLQTVKPELRVPASIFISVATGIGAGVLGMLFAGALMKWCDPEHLAAPLDGYRRYFLIALPILLPGIWIIARLKPLPEEKRKLKRTWPVSH